ncbi:glycoside hydrolase family 10 protein [Rivularia sp. UHCC 0363]|uniref:glycoside hydrolase family 10 protein n=1 Tax=Rivularia sp. UHCC 0363 TaxID=3110244 RepID=UPI002B1FB429|nr:family 10 glycosylhydrolase [Rivularia sp. UHCC 0363]MEA5594505.1 family 10 glycosylhydrolase [Rivularia sp. UHCC 0363]
MTSILKTKAILVSVLLLGIASPVYSQPKPGKLENITPPAVTREFRGAWIATVANIDFPSKPGLTTEEQKAELVSLLDKAAEINLNAVVLQIRPISDALYNSPYEPWSEFLSGEMGKPPQPFYDPLEFAVTEAHKRGLELHAWFNPYRAHHPETISPISSNHISKTRPDFVKQYGKYLWLDPGEKQVQDYSLKVILDVVRRYDIDGVHIDDYFYPYPQRDEQNKIIDFPDEISWNKYLNTGGKLNRADWRRENINTFVRRMYSDVKKQKPWVKVGVSPFGVWQPGYPERITNIDRGATFNAYEQIYADSRKWLQEGWLDYLAPQLYWKIEQTAQSYPVLLNWWLSQNTKSRSIFPGIYTSRISNEKSKGWDASEIAYQIRTTRGFTKTSGNIHFSMKALMENRDGIADTLKNEIYAQPALIPATPWLNNIKPNKPELKIIQDKKLGQIRLYWQPKGKQQIQSWVVQIKKGDEWTTKILPGSNNSYFVNDMQVENIAVSGVSRYGIGGKTAVVGVEEE